MKSKEIVVIGSGIAGITSVIKLKKMGYEPTLVTKGSGSSIMFSGSFDIASIIESKSLRELAIPIIEQVELVKNRNKNHPFNKINELQKNIEDSFNLINDKLNLNMIKLDLNKPNYIIPTQTGYLKETATMSRMSEGLDLRSMMSSGENYGILNISLFKDFFYERLLYNLNKIKKEVKSKSNFYIIDFDFLKRSSDSNLKNYDLARMLEHNDLYFEIIEKISEIAKAQNIKNIISPAVWGIDRFRDIRKELNKRFNFIESLSKTPSIYGIRLNKKINNYLKENEIKVIKEKIIGYDSYRNRITSITTNKNTKIETSAIILATGKFIGGGVDADFNGYKESIFNIPLFYNNKPLNSNIKEPMFENNYLRKHPAFSIGVNINKRFQPLDIDNKVVFNNLFAAGNIIADYNYIAREGGFGVAISTGYKAAKSLAQII